MIILRTGILYSILICAFISFSSFYSSFLISLKPKKSEEDAPLVLFLNMFGLYWLIFMISNVFGWAGAPSVYKPLSFLLNFILFLQPVPLLYYFTKNRFAVLAYLIFGFAFYFLSLEDTLRLTAVSYWGVQPGFSQVPRLIFILGLMAPLAALAIIRAGKDFAKWTKPLFVEAITLVFACLETLNILSNSATWELLLLRMLYVFIGFIAYFYLTGEEATAQFAQRISPRIGNMVRRLRSMRIPFFTKLLLLFVLLSILPIAGAGILLFLTFKEIIDLYIYKPLLWNLKLSKEEFLVALGNVQIQALFLITLTIILVVIASSIASRAIAQSLRRVGFGMKRVEEGDLSFKLSPESNDEIGDLVNYFNKMAAEIKRSREIMQNWNKELEKTVDERTKNLQTLYNISKAMGSTLDLEELISKSVNYIPQIAGSTYLSIFIKDDKAIYRSKASKGKQIDHSFKENEGLLGEIVSSGHICKMVDINEASEGEKKAFEPLGMKALLLAPMESKGKAIGLIVIGIQKDHIPSNIELNLLSTIADQMAIAIENASVFEKEKEAVKKLIEIDKMKTELLSMVSHELRTPLTSIKGFLAHFINGTTGPLNETQKKFVDIMAKEGDHLLEYIDTLLEFSRVERGAFVIKKEPVQIDKLINGIVEALRPLLESKGIELALHLGAKDAVLSVDELKLGQVLRNLIGNSIKFVKEKPQIEVSSKVLPNGAIEVAVKDNGIGIDKDHLGKIFNKFYQVDTSLTRKVGGLGLGLAISKEIVEAHGGRICAESEGAGKGSTFIFTIPVIK
jgi:signal transduction histidine kinase/HAMP domain-containing protein